MVANLDAATDASAERSGTLRLRVGDYHVIFSDSGVVLVVIKVGHRSGIYE